MLCGLAASAIMGYDVVLAFCESRSHDGDFFNDLGGRLPMAKRAFSSLKENPLFGEGIGYMGNIDIYDPKKGALGWYHSWPFQVIGSMGIVGILAYGYQCVLRIKVMLFSKAALPLAFCVVYVSIFIMSCFNPGEFCPLPYELLVIMIFVLLEIEQEKCKNIRNLEI